MRTFCFQKFTPNLEFTISVKLDKWYKTADLFFNITGYVLFKNKFFNDPILVKYYFNFYLFVLFLYFCGHVYAWVHACRPRSCSPCLDRKRASYFLGQEFQIVVSHLVGAGNRTSDFYKSSQGCQPWSNPPGPSFSVS